MIDDREAAYVEKVTSQRDDARNEAWGAKGTLQMIRQILADTDRPAETRLARIAEIVAAQ